MTSLLSFRKATVSDIPGIKKILDEAREAQRQQGFTQWEEGYPSKGVIAADIESGRGYLLEEETELAAYSAIGFSDREYERLENIWNHHGPYGVIHRTGIADRYRGRHVSAILLFLRKSHQGQRGWSRQDRYGDEQPRDATHPFQKRIHQPWGPEFHLGRKNRSRKNIYLNKYFTFTL